MSNARKRIDEPDMGRPSPSRPTGDTCERIRPLGDELLTELAETAAKSPRLRHTHPILDCPAGARWMLIALQPGTYVRPHRHLNAGGEAASEFLFVLQGELGLITFDDRARLLDTVRLAPSHTRRDHAGVEIPTGTFHTVVVLARDTVVLELKEGIYPPDADKDFPPWSLPDNSPEASELVKRWRAIFSSQPSDTSAPHRITKALVRWLGGPCRRLRKSTRQWP